MRVAPIALVLMFAISNHIRAQTPTSPKDFTVSAFILSSQASSNMALRDDNSDGAPFVLWVGIRNTTSRPYAMCTTGTGLIYRNSISGSGRTCFLNWIVLPGETHFERMTEMSLDDGASTITATVSVRGKSLASTGPPLTWDLRWEGTVADALALGEWMAGAP
jgi:hypothetical protein